MTYIIKEYEEYGSPDYTTDNNGKSVITRSILAWDKQCDQINVNDYIILDESGWYKVINKCVVNDEYIFYITDNWE
jgi:hypothetical protein